MSEINPRRISDTIDKLTDDIKEAKGLLSSSLPFTGKSEFLLQMDRDVIEAEKLRQQLLEI